MVLNKVCPCNSCGKVNRCISHDTFNFYCNRCLPYFIRGQFYDQPTVETTTNESQNTGQKGTGRKPKS